MRPLLISLVVLVAVPRLTPCQDKMPGRMSPERLYRIDAQTADGLHRLMTYDGQPMPLLSAHRGGAQPGFPENCLATFEHTISHTFSMLEIDLQYTKDHHLVLQHDPTLDRTTTGKGRLADRTLAELRELRLKDSEGKVTDHQISTLDDVFEWARGKTILVLDKKSVSVPDCVKQIESHHAEAYAMIMAYNFDDVRTCYRLNKDIMMEAMIGDPGRFKGFEDTGVPFSRIMAFVGHTPPQDNGLIGMIHAKGACCEEGTSRNLDRQLRRDSGNSLEPKYRAILQSGVDVIEADLPIQVGKLLYSHPVIPASKTQYFHLPAGEGK